MSLRITDGGITLPDEIVTETLAILAKRGMGKSNSAVVLAEEMHKRRFQWVAIDPKGDWWGIQASSDGTGPGLPIPVFGGRHGNLPLEAGSGELMARLVIEQDLTCILDVSLFSKGEQIRFVTDFAETLFKLIGDSPRPLHLFLEEAEEFLPQVVNARAARMVGAYSKIAKQGRTFGLGVTLISQRSASLNKDALSQTDTLVLFRTTSPHDRKAVVAWADHHDEAPEIAGSLAQLAPGESWILSPGFLQRIERVTWRRRETFDSGATPLTGVKRRRDPAGLADIDLGEIGKLMAATIERAQATDPTALQARVRQLEKQLATAPAPEAVVETIEVHLLDEGLVSRVEKAIGVLRDHGEAITDVAQVLVDNLAMARVVANGSHDVSRARRPARPAAPAPPAAPRPASAPKSDGGAALGKAERAILTVLASRGPSNRRQAALLAGYSAGGGGFGNALSRLRTRGFLEGTDHLTATQDGLDALGPWEPLPAGDQLLDYWAAKLGKAPGLVLRYLVDIWPAAASRDDTAVATGYEAGGGGFGNALSKLRTLDLIDGGTRGEPLRASDDLMAGIR